MIYFSWNHLWKITHSLIFSMSSQYFLNGLRTLNILQWLMWILIQNSATVAKFLFSDFFQIFVTDLVSATKLCEVYYNWYLLWWCKAAASVHSFTSIIIYHFVHNLQTFFCDNITWALVIVEYFVSGILYTMYCFATVGQNLPTLITLNELHFIICNSFFCRQLCICILMQQYGLSALHALLLFLS